jgi:uncharacterized protein YkwD
MKFRRLPVLFGALLAAATLLLSTHPAAAGATIGNVSIPATPRPTSLGTIEQALIDLTNADREANGLEPLDQDPMTLAIARERAESQLGPHSLTHYDARGELIFAQLLHDSKVPFQLAGENLARTAVDDATVTSRVERALMESATHRKNILERTFTRISIGAAVDAHGQIAFAELYRD